MWARAIQQLTIIIGDEARRKREEGRRKKEEG
jgi:hypothetical protein